MNKLLGPLFVSFVLLTTSCSLVKKSSQAAGDDTIKILDEHVAALAKTLGKDQKTYRMHVRTDVDGAKIYRQIGRYIIVDPSGEIIYVPDRI